MASTITYWPATFEDISDDEMDYSEELSGYNEPIDMSDNNKPINYSMSHLVKKEAEDSAQNVMNVSPQKCANTIVKLESFDHEENDLVIDTSLHIDMEENDEKLLLEWNDERETSNIVTPPPQELHLKLETVTPPPTPTEKEEEDSKFREMVAKTKFVFKPEEIVKTKDATSTMRKKKSKSSKAKVELFDCQYCTRKYWKESKLKDHIKSKHGQKFGSLKKDEKKSAVTVDGDKRYLISKCPDCKKQLQTKTDMYVHRLTHILPSFSTMGCPVCHQSQNSYAMMKDHMQECHGVHEKWFCPICPDIRTFTQNHSLLIHISTFHFDVNKNAPAQYHCEKCKKAFNSKALLGKHINNDHLGYIYNQKNYKLFKCDMCDKHFQDVSQLKKHLIHDHISSDYKQFAKSPKKEKEEFTAKFLAFKKKHIAARKPASSFTISSLLSKA